MTAAAYRRLLGLLLLFAVVPMPFLYIVQPPFWLLGIAVGLLLAFRPELELRLSGTALNVLGVLIIVVVLAVGGLRVGPLRPLGHLLLMLTSVRALTVADRQSFLRALLPVALVWIVSVTASTHIAVVPYFVASAVLCWWAGMRLLLAGLVGSAAAMRGLPRPDHAAAGAAVALVLAGLVFVALPRLREPWIAGRGGASTMTGFRSHVELGGVGTIQESPAAAILVRSVSGEPLDPAWMRLRATALERVTLDSWSPRAANRVPQIDNGLIWIHGGGWAGEPTVELEIELLRPRRYLFLPQGTVALWSPVAVRLDPANGVALAARVPGPLRYRVLLVRDHGPRPADPPPPSLRTFEPQPAVRALALEMVRGQQSDIARAIAVERYLREHFRYSRSGMLHMRSDPVEWFLLEQRAGHCEYFAGAMVALLSDLGIPARMVTGYSGGDLSADGSLAVVRESNAHAWVEARVGQGSEWMTFDPTPAEDVPALRRLSGRERIVWAVDWVQSAWDRYVLTFGFGEQASLVSGAAGAVAALGRRISWPLLVATSTLVGALLVLLRRRRPRALRRPRAPGSGPAAGAVERIALRLQKAGVEVPRRATVRWIAHRGGAVWPGAGPAFSELATLAERELYAAGGRAADRAVVRGLWRAARREMGRIRS